MEGVVSKLMVATLVMMLDAFVMLVDKSMRWWGDVIVSGMVKWKQDKEQQAGSAFKRWEKTRLKVLQ